MKTKLLLRAFIAMLLSSVPAVAQTWVAQTSGMTYNLNAVAFTDVNNGWAVGGGDYSYQTILRTTNSGVSWVAQTSPVWRSLKGVSFTDTNNGWAVADETILHTTNGGTNWSIQTTRTNESLNGVAFVDANRGWVVGYNWTSGTGRILRTTNGGASWSTQTSGTTYTLYDVAFTDANNGWVVGSAGTIRHTTNGGANWSTQTSGTSYGLTSVAFTDANNGWAVGSAGTIRHTTNGGANWYTQTSGTTNTLYDVAFADANNGWAVGGYGTILHTTNGGANWVAHISGTSNNLYGISFIDINSGWAVGNAGTILRSVRLRVASPNGGEQMAIGSSTMVQWGAYLLTGNVSVELNRSYPVGVWETIVASTPIDQPFSWMVTGPASSTARVRVSSLDSVQYIDTSDTDFGIYSTLVTLLSPNGGELWSASPGNNPPRLIVWNRQGTAADHVALFYSSDGGATYPNVITSNTPDTGSYSWTVPTTTNGSTFRVKVELRNGANAVVGSDVSDGNFSIDSEAPTGTITLSSPANDVWTSGKPQFQWSLSGVSGATGLGIWVDGNRYLISGLSVSTTWYQVPDSLSLLDGMHTWTVRALDDAGNYVQATGTRSIRVDATPPALFNLLLPENNVWTTDNTPTYQWSPSSDGETGLAKYRIYVDSVLHKDNIHRDSTRFQYGTVFQDDMESGTSNWNRQGTWGLTTSDPHGGMNSMTDSPGGNYGNNQNVAATMAAPFNLSGATSLALRYYCRYDLRRISNSYDSVYVEISQNASSWTQVYRYSGTQTEWTLAIHNLNSYASWTQIYVRFRLKTDGSYTADGFYFDDFQLEKGGNSLSDGHHTWYVSALDSVGNSRSSTQTWDINVDTTPPRKSALVQGIKGDYYSGTDFASFWGSRTDNNVDFNWGSGGPYGGLSDHFSVRWTGVVQTTAAGTYSFRTVTDDGVRLWVNNTLIVDQWHDNNSTPYSASINLSASALIPIRMEYYEHTQGAIARLYWTVPGNAEQIVPAQSLWLDPLIAAQNPPSSQWTRDSLITFTWTFCIDEGIGMDHYEVWIDGTNISGTIPPIDTTYTLTAEQALPNGDHVWYVKAFDLLGNVARSTSRTIRIDRIPPSPFSLTSVGGIAHDSALVTLPTPTFVWSATTDAGCGLSHYELWIDSLLNSDNLSTTSAEPADPLTEGYHPWFVVAVDNQDNRQFSTQTWRVIGDWNLPTQPLLVSPINYDTVGTSRPLMTWRKSTDAGSGVGRYLLYIDGTVRDSIVIPIGGTSADTLELRCRDSLINGDHNWYVKAIDRATNQRSSVTGYFYALRDITPPTSQITSHTSGQWAGGDTIFLTGTAQDNPNGSGVQRVDISFDDGNTWYPCVSGTFLLTNAMASDPFVETRHPVSESPALKTARNVPGRNSLLFETFPEQQAERSVYEWQYVWTGFSTATYSVRTRATDFENNVENPPSSCTINIDRTPPGIQSFSVSPNPAAAGLVSVSMTFSTGTHSGGMNLSDPPLVTFKVAGSDTVFVVQTNYSGNTWTGQSTIAPTQANGTARFTISGARDNLNNLFVRDTTRTFVIDTHPPLSFNLISPADSSWTNSPQLTLTWGAAVDTVSGIGHYELEIDGSTASPGRSYISAGQTTSTPATALTLGGHSWRIKAVDAAGNSTWSTASYRISVDLAVPVSTVISPPNGATIGGQCYTITGTSTDGSGVGVSGVDYVEIKIDNGTWERVVNTGTNYSTWSYQWCGFTNGSHTLRSRAIDHATNTEVPALQNSITVDLNPPVVRHPVVIAPSPCRVGPITATVYFHANPLGMDNSIHPHVWFTTAAGDSHAFIETSWSDTTWIGGANIIAGYANGSATVHVTGARDAIGNNLTADHSAGTFLIDTHAPAVTQTACSPRITNARNDLAVQINFAETVSGLNTGVNPSVRILPSSGGAISVAQSGYNGTSGVWTGTAIVSSLTAEGPAGISIARAVDNAGNVMDSTVITGQLIIDRTPPLAFDMITPVNDEWLAQTRPFFTWHRSADAVSGLRKHQLYINGELNVDNIPPSDTSAQGSTPLADGAYNWRIAAVDSSSPANTQMAGTSTRLFHIDNTAPVSGLTYPIVQDSLHGNEFTVTGTVNDGLGINAGIGVRWVLFSDNGGLTWDTAYAAATPVSGTVAWQYSWHRMIPGAHTLKSKAIDGLGNAEIPGGGVPVFIYGLPPTPFALSAPANGSNVTTPQVLIMWTASSDPDSGDHFDYVVQWSARSDFLTYLSATTTATQYLISDLPGLLENLWERRSRNVLDNLPDDTTVYWRVKAVDNLGNVRWATPDSNGWSFHVSIPDMPRVFTLISPVNGDTNRTLTPLLVWHRTTDPDPASNVRYDVWMDTTRNLVNRWQLADSLADTSFVVPCLLDSHTYYWTVRATDNNTAGRWADDTLMLRTIRPAVGGVAATDNRCDSVVITWSATAGADSFRIIRDGTPVAEVPGTVLRYTDAPSPGRYLYTVLGMNLCGPSPASSDSGKRLQFPGVPAGLPASDDLCGRVLLTWMMPTGNVDSIQVLRNGVQIASVAASAGTYTDNVIGSYAYQVRAHSNACGNGTLSAVDSGSGHAEGGVPTGLTAGTPDCDQISFSWTQSAGEVQRYYVYRDSVIWDSTTTLSYTDTQVPDAAWHNYRISAWNPFCGESMLSAVLTVHAQYLVALAMPLPDTVTCLDTVTIFLQHCSNVLSDSFFLSLNGGPFEFAAAYAPVQDSIHLIIPNQERLITPNCRLRAISHRATRTDTVPAGPFVIACPVNVEGTPDPVLPTDFVLAKNYPNPFNPMTTLRFGVPHEADVRIDAYDVLGRRVAALWQGVVQPGFHDVVWSCAECATGVYVIRMQSSSRVLMRKIMLLK